MNKHSMKVIPSSFRDHSGYMFSCDGIYYRSVQQVYQPQYEHLMKSGLYENLTKKKLFIEHTEDQLIEKSSDQIYILKPIQIPVISYVWEWTFSMLQEAAICTLDNALIGLQFGMILKDANSFNIQFVKGAPILIDSLSFDMYHEGESWIAYRQFCEQFLAPLLLMKYCNASLIKLTQAFPNGIPLDICKSMLPNRASFNMHVYLHIMLQSKLSATSTRKNEQRNARFSKQKLVTLLQGLKSFVQSLKLNKDKTTWDNYYDETILSKAYLDAKKKLVANYLNTLSFQTLVDLGANDGEFSRLYQQTNKQIIALDEDRNCIEKLYQDCKAQQIENILPLVCDLTAPSPSIGWNNDERPPLFQRLNADVTMALALIHHLAIANNIPLNKIIEFFASISPNLIIEFVPKEDPKVQELLANRKDIFDHYTLSDFKLAIAPYYQIVQETNVATTQRTLFLLKRIV